VTLDAPKEARALASEDPRRLLSAADPKREPRAFVLEMSRPLGTKRGKGKGSFVADTRQQAISFYRDLVQQLAAWRPKAPRLPDQGRPAPEENLPASEDPPAFAEAGRDPGEAVYPPA